MPFEMKPLACDPKRLRGLSEKLIVSHYENNYGGAVKRLNSIGSKLAELDYLKPHFDAFPHDRAFLRSLLADARSPQDYLSEIQRGGSDRRWPAAYELSRLMADPQVRALRTLTRISVAAIDLMDLLQSTVVRFYLDNGVAHTTAVYQRTLAAVRACGAQYLNATNRTITMGAAQLHVLAPPAGNSINNRSVGILIEYGQFRALFTGDSEVEELRCWLASGAIPR